MAEQLGVTLLEVVGGALIGGLSTWAAVAGKFGALVERVNAHGQRLDRIESKVDRVLDAVGAGRMRDRERPSE